VSDGTSQNPQTDSGQSREKANDGNDSSAGRDVAVISPKELQAELTKRLQPLLRSEKVGELVMNVRQALVQTTTMVQHRGPIPPPEQFGGYEKILPGSADRILKMAEKEQDHRHEWESGHLRWDGLINVVSLSFGWLLSLALAAGAVYCATIHEPAAAVALTGVAAFGAVGAILQGKRLFSKADHTAPGQIATEPKPAQQNKRGPKKRR
jgi:uncharacterized membrane protein